MKKPTKQQLCVRTHIVAGNCEDVSVSKLDGECVAKYRSYKEQGKCDLYAGFVSQCPRIGKWGINVD